MTLFRWRYCVYGILIINKIININYLHIYLIADSSAQLSQHIIDLNITLQEQLSSLTKKHEEQLSFLTKKHEEQLMSLTKTHEEQLSSLTKKHEELNKIHDNLNRAYDYLKHQKKVSGILNTFLNISKYSDSVLILNTLLSIQ